MAQQIQPIPVDGGTVGGAIRSHRAMQDPSRGVWCMRNSMLATVGLAAAFPVFARNHGVSGLAAFRARNSDTSIETLYKECTGNNFGNRTFCAGYISAMLDSMGMLGPAVSPKAFRIFPKVSVNAGAAVQAFKNWTQKHPRGMESG